MYDFLPTPAVVVRLDQVEKNIREMVEGCQKYHIDHRPHIKSHKSCYLAKMQLELGAKGITCAKLGEAETMAENGIRNILIAYALIGEDKMHRLGCLMDQSDVVTLVNSREGAQQLSDLGQMKKKKVRVLIDLDGGVNRGGKKPGKEAVEFAKAIRPLEGIDICGLMYYGGTIYAEDTEEGIDRVALLERDSLLTTARLMRDAGFSMQILSGGNSFSSKRPNLLEGITETRAGHYIFNDCGQVAVHFATEKQCALQVVSTVISTPDAHHAIIDAGSKTLSSDLCAHRPGFGIVVGRNDIRIAHLNEEHGYLESDRELNLKIGEKIAIIPNHACVVPNLTDEMYGLRGGVFDRMIRVDARGKNR